MTKKIAGAIETLPVPCPIEPMLAKRMAKLPTGDGWIFEVRVSDPATIEGLMDATAYEGQLS